MAARKISWLFCARGIKTGELKSGEPCTVATEYRASGVLEATPSRQWSLGVDKDSVCVCVCVFPLRVSFRAQKRGVREKQNEKLGKENVQSRCHSESCCRSKFHAKEILLLADATGQRLLPEARPSSVNSFCACCKIGNNPHRSQIS